MGREVRMPAPGRAPGTGALAQAEDYTAKYNARAPM